MKKSIAIIAASSALASPAVLMADGPLDGAVYGKVNVSIVNADSGDDQWELNSNASRLGVKGKTEISDGLYAIYKAEFEMCVDDGDCKGQTLTQRNIIGGIQGKYDYLSIANIVGAQNILKKPFSAVELKEAISSF